MLYGGGFVAERLVSGGDLLERKPEALVPVVRDILSDAKRITTREVFESSYKLYGLRQSIEATWRRIDALLVPTTPTIYRVEEVLASPRLLNSNLGVYTTFGNLMDLAAIAVPSGMRADGLPSGVQVIGPRGSDATLAAAASAYHEAVGGTMGATGLPLAPSSRTSTRNMAPTSPSRHAVVVVGAHLDGQPLNHQLVDLGATLVRACATAPAYRLYALRASGAPQARSGPRARGRTRHRGRGLVARYTLFWRLRGRHPAAPVRRLDRARRRQLRAGFPLRERRHRRRDRHLRTTAAGARTCTPAASFRGRRSRANA